MLTTIITTILTYLTKTNDEGKRTPNTAGVVLMVVGIGFGVYGSYSMATAAISADTTFRVKVKQHLDVEVPAQSKAIEVLGARVERLEDASKRRERWEERQEKKTDALLWDRGISPSKVAPK